MSGNVTQDDNTFDENNSLDDGHETDTDRNVRLGPFDALIMADQILVANGCGTWQERQAACDAQARQEEEEKKDEEEVGETGEEGEGGEIVEGGNTAEGGDPFIAHLMPDSAINQFLAAGPALPEKLEKNAWPSIIPVSKSKKTDQAPLKEANHKIMKAVELSKQMYKKACSDHASFTKIIKGGASALTPAHKDIRTVQSAI